MAKETNFSPKANASAANVLPVFSTKTPVSKAAKATTESTVRDPLSDRSSDSSDVEAHAADAPARTYLHSSPASVSTPSLSTAPLTTDANANANAKPSKISHFDKILDEYASLADAPDKHTDTQTPSQAQTQTNIQTDKLEHKSENDILVTSAYSVHGADTPRVPQDSMHTRVATDEPVLPSAVFNLFKAVPPGRVTPEQAVPSLPSTPGLNGRTDIQTPLPPDDGFTDNGDTTDLANSAQTERLSTGS